MATNSDRTVKSVTYYQPGPVPILGNLTADAPLAPENAPGPIGWHYSCFVDGVQVELVDGSEKNVSDINIGDEVKTDKGDGVVTRVYSSKAGGQKLYGFNDKEPFVTEAHPFMTQDGWKKISEVAEGDTLYRNGKGIVTVKSVISKEIPEDTPVYNFHVDGHETYFADGYLVHNKTYAPGYEPGGPNFVPGTEPQSGTFPPGYDIGGANNVTSSGIDILGEYLRNELKQLGDVLFNQASFRLERTNAIPDRPRAGDIRYFDGTNADPLGTGIEGLYVFKKGSPGNWVNLLALDSGTVEISGASGDLAIEIDNNVANSANLTIRCDAGSPRADFYVDNQVHITLNGQRVGILDTSPSYTLDVFGDGRFVQQLTVDAGIACADTVVSRPRFTDYSETVSAIGTKTAAFNIDLEDGNVQTLTLSGGGTFNIGITNALSSHSNSVTILGTNLGSCTASFKAGAHGGGGNAVYWADGDDTSDNMMTSSGTDVITFTTFDGGTNFYGFVAGKGMTNS